MQHARGFIVGCANRVTLISWEAEHTEQQIGQAFYRQKNHTISILHTGYKVIGYMFVKQSYWYKLRGFLFKLKAILLFKRRRLLFKLRRPRAFQLSRGLFTGCILIGWLQVTGWGRGNPTISRETETPVLATCQPQPRQPYIIKLISQLQKPTRKISDTWIIDTSKRETRYQLVKVHQTSHYALIVLFRWAW